MKTLTTMMTLMTKRTGLAGAVLVLGLGLITYVPSISLTFVRAFF